MREAVPAGGPGKDPIIMQKVTEKPSLKRQGDRAAGDAVPVGPPKGGSRSSG